MKIELKSHVKISSILWAGLAFGIGACATSPGTNDYEGKDNEVSLSEDRSRLDELRKDLPSEIKKENDELALLLNSLNPNTSENILPSYEISNRFNRIMQKKRNEFQRGLKTERDEFTRIEKISREKFLQEQKSDRDGFNRSKKSSDERRYFSELQSQKREATFADSREKRMSFEEQMRTKQKDFEFSARSKTSEFNQLLKSYNDYIKERARMKKKEQLIKPMPSNSQPLEAEPLGK
ncbi:MAG: hypothetical protein SGJ18_04425 [Pseudomonadota bacterium]|nr:hypothetical protein [Pseudomonadota bacterium]